MKKDRGYAKMVISVFDQNIKAKAFYEKLIKELRHKETAVRTAVEALKKRAR